MRGWTPRADECQPANARRSVVAAALPKGCRRGRVRPPPERWHVPGCAKLRQGQSHRYNRTAAGCAKLRQGQSHRYNRWASSCPLPSTISPPANRVDGLSTPERPRPAQRRWAPWSANRVDDPSTPGQSLRFVHMHFSCSYDVIESVLVFRVASQLHKRTATCR